METQRKVALGVFIFIYQVSYFHTINGHACIPEERIDSSGKHRWSVDKVERCKCQAFVIPSVTTFEHQRCANNSDYFNNEELFFFDDIKQLADRQNWVKDKLDILLDRDECYVNECDAKPCLNNAVCYDRVGRYICKCGRGFEGINCEIDIEAPEIVCPTGHHVMATDLGRAFASFSFDTFATDNSGKTPAVYCSKSSQSAFEIGETNVTCTSFDEAYNKGTCHFTVDVQDTEDPDIFCPESLFADSCESSTVVSFDTMVTDNSNQIRSWYCTKESGELFNIGNTTVICTAVDEAGNSATCQFSVTVMGWLKFNNHCYFFSHTHGFYDVFYGDADDYCRSVGANLTSIHSAEEHAFITANALEYDWIGLYEVVEGTYNWTDGTSLNYTNWNNGAPHDDQIQGCVFLFGSGWEDHHCFHTHGFICKT